jgi:hypothetical protein
VLLFAAVKPFVHWQYSLLEYTPERSCQPAGGSQHCGLLVLCPQLPLSLPLLAIIPFLTPL